MPLWVPPPGFAEFQTNLTTPVLNAVGTTVTAGGTAHVKNTTYATLISSLNFDVYGITIMFSNVFTTATATSILVDIAVGAAAAESVIIPNLIAGSATEFTSSAKPGGQKYYFPLYIPSGARLSATAQALIVSDTVQVAVFCHGAPRNPGVWTGTRVTDYGTNAGTSKGTDVACGLSAAEGTYTQLVASTSEAHDYMAFGVGGAADTTFQPGVVFLDVGVGAATEATLVQNLPFSTSSAEDVSMPFPFSSWVPVANAQRIAARLSTDNASAQSYDVAAYGVS